MSWIYTYHKYSNEGLPVELSRFIPVPDSNNLINPLIPEYNKSAADDFENMFAKLWKIFTNNSIIIELSSKHFGKRRNCYNLFFMLSKRTIQRVSHSANSVVKCVAFSTYLKTLNITLKVFEVYLIPTSPSWN